MSEAKHTKGTWFVSAECNEIVVAEDPIYGVQVADCGKPASDEYQPPEGEAAANAALISAAPDLLAALKDMASGWQYIRQMHGDLSGVGWDRCANSAALAIAKAEGRTS